MWLSNLAGGLIILIIGFLIRVFKTANLISGYNTLPKREKEKYDTDKLCRYVGNMLIISALVLFLGAALSAIQGLDIVILTASWLFFIVFIICGAVYMNIGNKFLK